MSSEAQMWTALRPFMDAEKLDPVRVENPAMPGTPDVNFTGGWIELKHADRWPPRGGPLQLGHPPTPEQKVWLYRRYSRNGRAFLLLRVGKEWFVFKGIDVKEVWAEPPMEVDLRLWALMTFQHPREVAAYFARLS